MGKTDNYKVSLKPGCDEIVEKKSRFIANVLPVQSVQEAEEQIAAFQKKFWDARHNCYAFVIGSDFGTTRCSDNGEPSGTAGRPIHGQLLSKDLTDTLIIVIRYFGGIKLGVSGLINAYKTAAKDALDNNTIVERFVEEDYQLHFPPLSMNKVMQLLKRETVKITDQQYDTDCIIRFTVQKRDADNLLEALRKVDGAVVEAAI